MNTRFVALDLSNNYFQRFPIGVTTLPALQVLNLNTYPYGKHGISEVPKNIARMETLEEFRIANRRILVEFPVEMRGMKNLKLIEASWGDAPDPPPPLQELLPDCELVSPF